MSGPSALASSPPAPRATSKTLSIDPSSALRPAAWLVAAYTIITTVTDPDLWGHVRFGQDILRDRALPRLDAYSFTQDRPWINHEWLSEVMMGAAFDAAGALGLVLLKATLAAAAIAVVWGSLRHATTAWRWGTAALVTVPLMPLQTTVRPQLWTVLLLAVLCRCLTANDRRRWMIPMLFPLWANVHGGWIVGLGVLGAWTLGTWLERRYDVRLVAICALSLLATLATPYGGELWQFIATTVRLERNDITEWQPVWSNATAAALWLVGPVFLAVVWKKLGRPPLPVLLVTLMMAVASARVVRLLGLFVLCTAMLNTRRMPRATPQRTPPAQTLVEAAICSVAIAVLLRIGAGLTCIDMKPGRPPDPPVFAAMIEARLQGRIVNAFDWGEALLARLGPGLKVSIDGRRETVYTAVTIQEQGAIRIGSAAGLAALDRLSPDYVWLPLPSSARTLAWLRENGYRIDFETAKSFLAVRAGSPPIRPAGRVPPMCYPFV